MHPMKTFPLITLTAGFAAGTVFAIEAPPDDAPPPIEVAPPAAAPPAAAPPAAAPPAVPLKAESAYLGVVCSGIPEMLAAHLGLQAGEGIVVRALMPDGPAAQAGLAEHDVITRIGGEALGSSEDLTREVASLAPGDKVRLDVIHKGKPAVIDVTLGVRPAQLPAPQARALDQLNLDGVPRELADRVQRMIEGNLGDLRLDIDQGIQEAAPQMEDAMREMRQRIEQAMQGLQIPDVQIPERGIHLPQGGIQIQQGATFRLMDDQGSIELKSNDGGKEITVRDKNNNLTWTGPWDTDQDKAAAPEDIRQRVERLNIDTNGKGLRLQLQGGKLGPGGP